MKIIIVSDNHSRKNICQQIADKYSHSENILLHCGDSEFSYNDEELASFIKVTGNCDYDHKFPEIELLDTPLGKVFLAHGHYYRVGFSRNIIAREAAKHQAKFAIYGHTHIPRCELIDGVLCINPGSIAQSRAIDFPNCYATVEQLANEYRITYYDDNHQLLTFVDIAN